MAAGVAADAGLLAALMRAQANPAQLELLDWVPPQPVRRFDPVVTRASSLSGMVARVVSATLRDCPKPREIVAAEMSKILGERVPVCALNQYASEARTDHTISATRLLALLKVTGDARLLQALADPVHLAVVEPHYLPMIEAAALHERIADLKRRHASLRRHLLARRKAA